MDGRTKGRDAYSGSIRPAHKAANDDFGRWTNTSSRQVRGLKELVLHVYTNVGKHRVLALAAGVAFYSILAIFPALAALVGIYGLFADPTTISTHLDSVAGFLPGGAIDVIKDQLSRIASRGRSTLGLAFVVGLGVSLWSANAGLKALFDALNLIHESEEKRGFIKLNAVSLAFTILGIIFAILAVGAVVVIPVVLAASGLGGVTELLVNFGRWPILFLVVALVLAPDLPLRALSSRPPMAMDNLGQRICLCWLDCAFCPLLLVCGEFWQLQCDLRIARRNHGLHGMAVAVDNCRPAEC